MQYEQAFMILPQKTKWGVTPPAMVIAQSEWEANQLMREGAKAVDFEEYNRWFAEHDGMYV